jgi:molybdate transport system substrate-binding protein
MGNTPGAVPARIRRREPIDVVIMLGDALGDLIKEGKVIADSRVDLARSSIGVAVRTGAPKPDISSVDAVRLALLAAKSIAYSDSASGVYVSTELFKRLDIVDQVAGKSRMIPAEPVGAVVARGEAKLGFQQMSELKPIAGIELIGPLPPELQKITIFSAGIVVGATEPDAAQIADRLPRFTQRRRRHQRKRLGARDIRWPTIKNGSNQKPLFVSGAIAGSRVERVSFFLLRI